MAKVKNNCFFKHCRREVRDEKTSCFSAPTDEIFKQWRQLITESGFVRRSRICARHFDEDDVTKGRTIGGQYYHLKKWQLRVGAIPKHHLKESLKSIIISSSHEKTASNKNGDETQATQCVDKSAEQQNESSGDSEVQITIPHASENQSSTALSSSPNVNTSKELSQEHSSKVSGTSAKSAGSAAVTPIYGSDHTYIVSKSVIQNNPSMTSDNSNLIENLENVIDEVIKGSSSAKNSSSAGSEQHETPLNQKLLISKNQPRARLNKNDEKSDSSTSAAQIVSVGLTNKFLGEIQIKVALPTKHWFWLINKALKQASCSHYIPQNDHMLMKTLVITSPTTASFLVNGRPMNLNIKKTFCSYAGLTTLLRRFHESNLCEGIRDEAFRKIQPSAAMLAFKEENGTIRSKNCTILAIPGNMCLKCKSLYVYIKKNSERLLSKVKKPNQRAKIKSMRQKINRLTRRLEKRKTKLTELKSQLEKVTVELNRNSIDVLMQQLNPLERTVMKLFMVRTSIRDRDQNGNGARYEDSVMNHSALLWLKSPSTYKFLRRHNIVPLPSFTSVSNYIKAHKAELRNVDSEFVKNLVGLDDPDKEPEPEADDEPMEFIEASMIHGCVYQDSGSADGYADIEIDVIVSQ